MFVPILGSALPMRSRINSLCRRKQSLSSCILQYGAISFPSANPCSTFDSAAHFYGGDTTSLTLPAAVPADSLVCLGPNLLLARFNFRGFFSECFIPSTTDTSEHDKTPVDLCVRHNGPLAPEEYGANLTVGFRPTTRVE